MKQIFTMCLAALCFQSAKAQLGNAAPDDYLGLFKRTLFVELPDTSGRPRPGTMAYPQKDLGQLIKKAVDEMWRVNTKVEYLSQDVVKKNLERNENKGVYMMLAKHQSSTNEQQIWVLMYSSAAGINGGKPDYEIFLPMIQTRAARKWTEIDLNFTITVMQENMKFSQKNGKKTSPGDFMANEGARSCKGNKARHVMIDASVLDKSTDEKALRKGLKKVAGYTIATLDQINETVLAQPDTTAFIIIYPRDFMTLSSSAFGQKYAIYQKVLVAGGTYKVIGSAGHGKRDNILIGIQEADLKLMAECAN